MPVEPSLGADGSELPLPLEEDVVPPFERPPSGSGSADLPPPIEEEVARLGEDVSPGDDPGQSGYDLTEEEKAMGIETFRVAPRPARDWRVLAYP